MTAYASNEVPASVTPNLSKDLKAWLNDAMGMLMAMATKVPSGNPSKSLTSRLRAGLSMV
jgi:hypothetical protein